MATTMTNNPNAPMVNRGTHAWRSQFATPFLFGIGACCWLVGAALLVAAEPRNGFIIDDINGDSGKFVGAGILFIIGSCFWILAALVSLSSAMIEATALKVMGRVPGIGRLLVMAGWLELLAAIVFLVGSALFLGGDTFRVVSGGAILFLIGSWLWLMAQLAYSVIALVVASVTALMPSMLHRQSSWFSVASTLMFTAGWVFFTVGAAAMVVLSGPGFMLLCGLLWLVATATWIMAFLVRGCGSYRYYVPVMSYATAAAATSGLMAGTAGQVGAGAAMPAGKTVVTDGESKIMPGATNAGMAPGTNATMVPTTAAVPGATHAAAPTMPAAGTVPAQVAV